VLRRAIFGAILLALVTAGCAVTEHAATPPEGPFTIAIFATTDTRGELEPCG